MIVLPVNLSQVELRRGNHLTVASFLLEDGQELLLRNMSISVLKQLSGGYYPVRINSQYGNCYVGLFNNKCLVNPIAVISSGDGAGFFGMDNFNLVRMLSPGVYSLVVVNNTGPSYDTAVDYSVSVTASFSLYL